MAWPTAACPWTAPAHSGRGVRLLVPRCLEGAARMPSASTHGAQAIQNIVRRLGVREVTVQVCQGMQQRDGLLRPRRDEGGVRGQAAPYRRPGRPRSSTALPSRRASTRRCRTFTPKAGWNEPSDALVA